MYRQCLLIGSLAVFPLGCGSASGEQERNPPVPVALTPEEIGQARVIAEKDLPVDSLPSQGMILFIKADLLPDAQAQSKTRHVMVHHYRYRNDETVFTMVDLDTQEVLSRETTAHYPTGLAAVEIERARELAQAEPRLIALFAEPGLTHDARPLQFTQASAPLFGHRVVHLMLKRGGNYLPAPRVVVDLTTATVHLEE